MKERLIVVSGHFNPLHTGHLDMIEQGAELGELLVVVKNDVQQLEKKGKIIRPESDRLRIIAALSAVSVALLSIDKDDTVRETLRHIATRFEDRTILFGNGGTTSDKDLIPETKVCEELGIEMIVGLGGFKKIISSTEINTSLGLH